MKWKLFFGFAGILSLGLILRNYGFEKLTTDVGALGWWAIPLILSFLPVAFLYSSAWWLVTPSAAARDFPTFLRVTIISIAWNNLSPFVKVLGEPVRVNLLQQRMDGKQALKSVLLYNLVHLYGTIGAFFVGGILILWIYPVPGAFRTGFLALIFSSLALLTVLWQIPKLRRKTKRRKGRATFWVKASFWLRWSLSNIRFFSSQHPLRFFVAIVIEVTARFVEGLTFYVAFKALGQSIQLSQAMLLDVGRAILDNVFFFVPYQMGSREAGVLLLSEEILGVARNAALSAAIFYRIVEISWMGIGYSLWIRAGSSRRS